MATDSSKDTKSELYQFIEEKFHSHLKDIRWEKASNSFSIMWYSIEFSVTNDNMTVTIPLFFLWKEKKSWAK
jgi:hypothetical protein